MIDVDIAYIEEHSYTVYIAKRPIIKSLEGVKVQEKSDFALQNKKNY